MSGVFKSILAQITQWESILCSSVFHKCWSMTGEPFLTYGPHTRNENLSTDKNDWFLKIIKQS